MAIALVVAGAGVAGLHYRNQLWDDRGHPDHVATMPAPTFALPVTLTNAEELAPASTVVITSDKDKDKEDEKKPDASPPPPRPTQPKARAPVAVKKPAAKEESPPEGEMFSKPE